MSRKRIACLTMISKTCGYKVLELDEISMRRYRECHEGNILTLMRTRIRILWWHSPFRLYYYELSESGQFTSNRIVANL
jgi:hypothetical protein